METATLERVKERPILFSGEMVRAILDGRKTQTRRVVAVHNSEVGSGTPFTDLDLEAAWTDKLWGVTPGLKAPSRVYPDVTERIYPRFSPGDRLWVREAHMIHEPRTNDSTGYVRYRADSDPAQDDLARREGLRWRPSIFMPRWASRLTLEVTDVRVERVQDISERDAKAEGCAPSESVVMKDGSPCYTIPFHNLWERIHGIDNPNAWDSNPWVWCVAFHPADAECATK